MDLNQIDVSALRVQDGDVLVFQMEDSWLPDDVDEGDSLLEAIVAHIRASLKEAGHERVGVLVTTGGKIEITIIRPES